jgi:hypothetical protein
LWKWVAECLPIQVGMPTCFFDAEDAAEGDFTIVDVHTQPTDEYGNVVGKILHTGVGKVNLGVFVARSPVDENRQMAFVGPVMSYYEKITDNFLRLTDQDWEEMVEQKYCRSGLPGQTSILPGQLARLMPPA